jgi:hypothetical protein
MSPVLFALFVEDLELFLQNDPDSGLSLEDFTIILMLFADDMALFGKTPHDLQANLDLLKVYSNCDRWGLEVNGGLKPGEQWTFGNTGLEVVHDFNYVGRVFNYTGALHLTKSIWREKG